VADLLTRAELVKLSRILGTTEQAVAFLASRGHLELRELETRISRALFDQHRVAFQRLVDASKLLPASLIAKMSELVFGPMLSARVAGLMPIERAIEVASRLRLKFRVDVTIQLDPRSASDLLARMPTPIVVEVAHELMQRKEYVTMGRFVDDLSDEAIRAVMTDVTDDAALVRIAGYVERRERLNDLIAMVPAARLPRVVAAVAAGPADLQDAGLIMMSQLDPKLQGRIGDVAVGLGAPTVTALVNAASRAKAPEIIRTVLRNIGPESRATLDRILPGAAG
jgi:hypothetical protein